MAKPVTSLTLTRRIESRSHDRAHRNDAVQGSWDQVRQDNANAAASVAETQRQLAVEESTRKAKRVEKVGQAVVASVDKRLSTEEGQASIANQVDGRTRRTRNTRQRTKIGRFVGKLKLRRRRKRLRVMAVKPGEKKTVVTNTGEHREAKLAAHEKKKVIEANDGSKVLVLSSNLSDVEAATEAAKVEADTIVDVAQETGVEVQPKFYDRFLDSTFEFLRDVYSINVWANIATFLGNYRDEQITEKVIDENNLAQQRVRETALRKGLTDR